MNPRILEIEQKKVIGTKVQMSVSTNKTHELWSRFMPRLREIKQTLNSDLLSIEIYPPHYFHSFQPTILFEKWASIGVLQDDEIPEGMHSLTIPSGLYAVFVYKGLESDAAPFFYAIFSEWLPSSPYAIDERPHFAIMGEKYQRNSADSEEEIWVPIKAK